MIHSPHVDANSQNQVATGCYSVIYALPMNQATTVWTSQVLFANPPYMKLSLLLVLFFALTSYGQEFNQREVLARLAALEVEVAKQRPAPVRWAVASRDKLRPAIYEVAREKLEQLKKADALPSETEAKVAHYEALRMELLRLSMSTSMRSSSPPLPPPTLSPIPSTVAVSIPALPSTPSSLPPLPLPKQVDVRPVQRIPASVLQMTASPTPEDDKAREALTRRVAEAKAPVAAIVERRNELTARYHSAQFLDQLIADYAKGRYDLVVDGSNESPFSRPILYRSAGEVTDITEGILQFLRDRE